MLSLSTRAARRMVPACVLATAAIAALGAPGVASASRLPKCTEGTKINGEGSTLQGAAMTEVWGSKAAKAYNSAGQKNAKACPGGTGSHVQHQRQNGQRQRHGKLVRA